MIVSIVKIECKNIHDWDSFYDEFSCVFGFPDFFGRNMDAWIDCMSSLNDPEDGLSKLHCEVGKVITIQLENVREFKKRCPEQYEAINECTAFVNFRLIEIGEQPVLALSYHA